MAIDRAPRRIKALEPMASEDIDKFRVPSSREPTAKGKAENWHLPIDYSNADTSENADTEDFGTMRIPVSRIALRDTNGLIPSTMLPSYVDDIMYGHMIPDDASYSSDPDYVAGCAVFVGVDKDGHMVGKYSTPTQPTGYLQPAENIIYFDNTTELQYRFTNQSGTTAPLHQFAEVPGSRALQTSYGIEIDNSSPSAVVNINAKKADYFSMYTATGPSEVGTSYTTFPFDQGSGKSENSVITVSASSNKITVENLVANVRYMVNLQLSATPKVLSANIIDVSFKCGSVPDQVQQMDMSGPAGATTKLNYVCVFTLSSGTSIDLQLKAEEAINVTTTRFTIYELL